MCVVEQAFTFRSPYKGGSFSNYITLQGFSLLFSQHSSVHVPGQGPKQGW